MHNPFHFFIRCNYQTGVWKGEQRCVLQEIYRKCVSTERVEGSFRGNRTRVCKQTIWEVKGQEGGVIGPQPPVWSASCMGHAEKFNWGEPKEGYLCRLSPCIKIQASVGFLHGEREKQEQRERKQAILLQSTIWSRRKIYSLLLCNLGYKLITE